jgi:acetolactate synthase-1/2/3 large subunit
MEHKKKTLSIDLFINADAKKFLENFLPTGLSDFKEWQKQCLVWKEKYPVCLLKYRQSSNGINLYHFMDELSNNLRPDGVVVADAGSAIYVPAQGFKATSNQRLILSGAQAEMGFTIPACIGVSIAKNDGDVVGITGDGSFQTNIQELQVIVQYKLPIKLFVWNNNGYLSIRSTQNRIFQGRLYGTDASNGVSLPDTRKIAEAYGIAYVKLDGSENLGEKIKKVLDMEGAVICEVMCISDQEIVPTVSSKKLDDGRMVSKPLEDMYPFLDREEFMSNMLVKPCEEPK